MNSPIGAGPISAMRPRSTLARCRPREFRCHPLVGLGRHGGDRGRGSRSGPGYGSGFRARRGPGAGQLRAGSPRIPVLPKHDPSPGEVPARSRLRCEGFHRRQPDAGGGAGDRGRAGQDSELNIPAIGVDCVTARGDRGFAHPPCGGQPARRRHRPQPHRRGAGPQSGVGRALRPLRRSRPRRKRARQCHGRRRRAGDPASASPPFREGCLAGCG